MPVEREITTPDLEIEQAPGVNIDVEQPLTNGNAMMLEDGSAIVNPMEEQPDVKNHNANLAEMVDESDLRSIAADLMSEFESDKNSRSDWEKTYTEGLDLLGFKYDDRARPFSGASGVTHPLLAEAVTQFQAQAYKELLPAGGPVRTVVVGQETPDIRQQAERVKEFMNYQITTVMEEYTPEMDQLLFYLPLAGSAFKKVYFDPIQKRAVAKFVAAEDLIINYMANDLDQADRVTHMLKMNNNDVRKLQISGFYRDVELSSGQVDPTDVKDKVDELQGLEKNYASDDGEHEILEMHINANQEKFYQFTEIGNKVTSHMRRNNILSTTSFYLALAFTALVLSTCSEVSQELQRQPSVNSLTLVRCPISLPDLRREGCAFETTITPFNPENSGMSTRREVQLETP